ncbi:MAG TPA: ribonuclease HIII, partial [Bacillus bacterium]|nr:ribonuclease HIII [Bacillus sp. (in: firmicutes)]
MGNIVLNKSQDEIRKMKEHYKQFLNDKLPPGSLFAAKTPACAITAYKSGKVLFQGKEGEAEASKWGGSVQSTAQKGVAKQAPSHL